MVIPVCLYGCILWLILVRGVEWEIKDKSDIEIGEMVLSECWDKKHLEELYQLDNREYAGEKFREDLYEEHGVKIVI